MGRRTLSKLPIADGAALYPRHLELVPGEDEAEDVEVADAEDVEVEEEAEVEDEAEVEEEAEEVPDAPPDRRSARHRIP